MRISGMGYRLVRACGALLLLATLTLCGAPGAEASPTAARKRRVVPPRPVAPASPTSALAAAVDPLSDHQYVFWRAADAHLYEAWFDHGWHGPIDTGWNSASPPAVALPGAGREYVFWQAANHDLYDASFNEGWSRARDLTRMNRWGRYGQSSSGVTVAADPGSDRLFAFWRAANGRIDEGWYDGRWHGPVRTGWTSASRPTVALGPGGHQYVYWEGTNHDIYEAWWYHRWSRPRDLTVADRWGSAGRSSSAVTVGAVPGTTHQFVLWHALDGQLYQAWFDGRWHGPVNTGWRSPVAPSVAVTSTGRWYAFWQDLGHIWQARYDASWSQPIRLWSLDPGSEPYVDAVQTTSDLLERLQPMSELQFGASAPAGIPTIAVNDGLHYQRITGVGAAMTDSSAWLIESQLSPAARDGLMDDLFGAGGIHLGFTIVPMGASDFTATGQPYSYDDLPAGEADPQLTQFSVAHDEGYILPALRQMLAVNPQTETFAVPWSAPPWMKANDAFDDMADRGTLLPADYQSLAAYFVRFLHAYQAEGVPISAVAPVNEPAAAAPYPSMRFSEPDEARWISQYLAPALSAADLHQRIYGMDSGWDSADYADALASSPASVELAGIAWHCYSGAPTVMSALQAAAPAMDQLVTECDPNLSPYPVPEIVIGALRNGASAVALWNLALDPSGGPVEAPNTGCTGCAGIVTISESTHSVTFNLDYYQLGQVGSFLQPGAVRVDSDSFVTYQQSPTDLSATPGLDDVAFVNPDGSHVLVAYDNSSNTTSFAVQWNGRSFTYTLPPWATVTFRWYPTG
jgi:O-glycosyl hydrolase